MRIGFCGTISVGKTTLVNALKELPEFADYNFKTERSKYLMELGIPLNTDSTIKGQVVFLAERGYDAQYGARPLKRAIQTYIEDLLADGILSKDIVKGSKAYTISHKKGDEKLSVK